MPTNSAGQNFRRTRESSLFGTRKLAFYTVQASTDYGMIGPRNTGYSFRVNTLTGAVTFDATITAKDYLDMYDETIGVIDDNTQQLTLPFNITFLGDTSNTIYIDSNSGINFSSSSYHRQGPYNPTTGDKEIFIANNDGDIQYLYTDSSVPGEYRVKFRGNTDYNNDTVVNLVWEALFREGENYIDFLVTAQPTEWSAYDDGQGNVTWGVTDGTNWVDGLGTHAESFAPFTSLSSENWNKSNSLYYKIVRAIQNAGAEIYWLGTPHNSSEPFQLDWTPLTPDDNADFFTFAIADDADAPQATLENTSTGTAVAVGGNDPNSIDFDNIPIDVYIGQRVVFTGTTFGGIVAGKDYYVKNKYLYDGDSKLTIFVSDSVDNEVLDIVYPAKIGGEPGNEVELTADTGSMTATFYNYSVEWGGTAGDITCACCANLTEPNIIPVRFITALNEANVFTGPGFWFMYRSSPSYGIFPAFWQAQI